MSSDSTELRKTAGNLVKRASDGETASVFLCHGETVQYDDLMDVYTDRNFSKVFTALDKVGEQLAPIFAKVAEPFRDEDALRYPVISLGTIKRIKELRQQGYRISKIAQLTDTSPTTVRRYI